MRICKTSFFSTSCVSEIDHAMGCAAPGRTQGIGCAKIDTQGVGAEASHNRGVCAVGRIFNT